MIIYKNKQIKKIKAAIFDFDGTLSALRCGWENIMLPMMVEYTAKEAEEECRKYIDESTGIQTIHQMKWLCQKAGEYGNPKNAELDPWFFKEEYTRRLNKNVKIKRELLEQSPSKSKQFLIGGAHDFLKLLKDSGVLLYAASGTDEEDVKTEARLLGIDKFFTSINGAKPHSENCSKEAVIAELINGTGIPSESILVCGDGKVEIELGVKNGCITLGVASDEEKLTGINNHKKDRLQAAGADAIIGDFTDKNNLTKWLML